jgi:hypothetical protein
MADIIPDAMKIRWPYFPWPDIHKTSEYGHVSIIVRGGWKSGGIHTGNSTRILFSPGVICETSDSGLGGVNTL